MILKWKTLRSNVASVLGMNRRNLHYIYPNNLRRDYPLADNKLLTKRCLEDAGLPVAKTYHIYQYFHEMRGLERDLADFDSFVIKPANGRGGGGIKVISRKQNAMWFDVNNNVISVADLRKQILDIVFGVYSFDTRDVAIVEEKVIQHAVINDIYEFGLSDIRMLVCKHKQIMSMIRIPTDQSGGRANLHQGAVGIGINIETGITTNAIFKSRSVSYHPDSGSQLEGIKIPYWQDLVQLCSEVSRLMPLRYIGIDIAISVNGPVILEVNVRPGIEIQNANQVGLREVFDAFKMAGVRHE